MEMALPVHRHDQGARILEARQVGATAITTTTKYTPLRPDNAALIMIHHQVGFMLDCQTPPADRLRTNPSGLATMPRPGRLTRSVN